MQFRTAAAVPVATTDDGSVLGATPSVPSGSGSASSSSGDRFDPAGLLRSAIAGASGPPLTAVLAMLNHVIRQQSWARQRLRPFAGQTVRLALDGGSAPARWLPPLQVRVSDDGSLQSMLPSARGRSAKVTLWLRPSLDLLGALAAPDREQRIAAHLRIEGDVMLAAALAELAHHLRWDVEDDLSRVLGDVAAHRISQTARSVRDETQRLAGRVQDLALQFVTAEQPLVVLGEQVRDRAIELDALEQRLVRLRARVDRLAGS